MVHHYEEAVHSFREGNVRIVAMQICVAMLITEVVVVRG